MIKMHVGDEDRVDVFRREADPAEHVFWLFPAGEGIARQPIVIAEAAVDKRNMLLAADFTAHEQGVDHRGVHIALVAVRTRAAEKVLHDIDLAVGEGPDRIVGIPFGECVKYRS